MAAMAKRELTKASCYYIDPLTKIETSLKRKESYTVDKAVGLYAGQVIDKMNEVYSFDPTLQSKDMAVEIFAGNTLLLYFFLF